MNISIIIPCYNENPSVLLETIDSVKKGIKTADYEIIVVNDGSKENYTVPEDVKLIKHQKNKGYGRALKTGIENSKFEWIGITDSDGTYPNELFQDLIDLANGVDMVIGLRDSKNMSWLNRTPKFFLKKFGEYITKNKIPDLNSGMRIFKKDLALKFWNIYPEGFSFTSTITLGAFSLQKDVKYVKIPYYKRVGKTKIKPIKDTLKFSSLILRMALYFKPLRVFIPLTILLTIAAIIRGSRDYLLNGHFGGITLIIFFIAFQTLFFGFLAEILSKKQ